MRDERDMCPEVTSLSRRLLQVLTGLPQPTTLWQPVRRLHNLALAP